MVVQLVLQKSGVKSLEFGVSSKILYSIFIIYHLSFIIPDISPIDLSFGRSSHKIRELIALITLYGNFFG